MPPVATLTTFLAIAIAPAPIAHPAHHHKKPQALQLKLKDSGRTVGLVPGQELRIRLYDCYDCGYVWHTQLEPDAAVLTRLKQRQQSLGDCHAPCAGGAAMTIFRYRAKAHGTTKLRLRYLPPGQQPATKVFKLRVNVR